ncbi:hypothetical protein EON66_10415 [archaeon]|nr:MAG: hypothetical protein EON66_10415 [archaeon]
MWLWCEEWGHTRRAGVCASCVPLFVYPLVWSALMVAARQRSNGTAGLNHIQHGYDGFHGCMDTIMRAAV